MTNKNTTHIQCHLIRTTAKHSYNEDNYTLMCYPVLEHYYCWLPKKFAVTGEIVDIKDVGEGWIVSETFTELPTAFVLERSQDYKKQRKASDI
jgi:hypothetical protein